MAGHLYQPFTTTDSFTHYQTSQSYAYLDSSYDIPSTSMDSFPSMQAPYDPDLSQTSRSKYPHSPGATDAEHFLPRLTASSESGQSTSSSAMGSPQLAAQYVQQEPWNPLISTPGLMPHDMSSDIFAREPFYTSSMEQESALPTKIPGFIGESMSNFRPPHFIQAGSFPLTHANQYLGYPKAHESINSSRQLPTPRPLRYQAAPILLSQHATSQVECGFKSPGLPASARQSPLRSLNYQDTR